MSSLPLASSAVLDSETLHHLAIAYQGEIIFLFPRGTPYAHVRRLASKIPRAEIRLQMVRATYEPLEHNEVYDTSASV